MLPAQNQNVLPSRLTTLECSFCIKNLALSVQNIQFCQNFQMCCFLNKFYFLHKTIQRASCTKTYNVFPAQNFIMCFLYNTCVSCTKLKNVVPAQKNKDVLPAHNYRTCTKPRMCFLHKLLNALYAQNSRICLLHKTLECAF